MLRRYPHTAIIRVTVENNPVDGITTVTPSDISIKGRYEPAGQNKALDYSAKFYCKNEDIAPFEVDGKPFIYEGKTFKITQLYPYQTHCEIWLE
ncbi:hypothetical protein [Aestuariibaculum marinum]|uniref:Uncharacterized protein n=1 Tax=Aestuariibaculum marinum TaxID=2683592 RepID=A0A8J6PSC3_9FLAO|nr:hypothetical protein [Aestuariibaculum marinum]MBD0822638.1 hypothetical protein [Aestuariibaculum marinum]